MTATNKTVLLSNNLTEAQCQAVESIDMNVLVSAGAGSGKTHVLVERYLNILLSNDTILPRNILAITYTNKASKEMRYRIKQRLQTMHNNDLTNARLVSMLEDLNNAHIGTIHSLCENILKENQTFLNYDLSHGITDKITMHKYIDKSIDEALNTLIANDSKAMQLLKEFDIDVIIANIKNYLNLSLELKDLTKGYYDKTSDDLFSEFKLNANTIFAQSLKLLISEFDLHELSFDFSTLRPNCKSAELYELGLTIVRKLENFKQRINFSDTELLDLSDCLRNFSDNTITCRVNKCNHAILKDFKDKISKFTKKTLYPLNENDEYSAKCLSYFLEILKTVELKFKDAKNTHKLFDYDDLIIQTLELLENEPVKLAYENKYDSILLDEFQDSNISQLQLISKLAHENTKLFFIGDDKQSIYKFQGASVEVFNTVRSLFRQESIDNSKLSHFKNFNLPKRIITLNENFRSCCSIVDFNNLLFKFLLTSQFKRSFDCEYNTLNSNVQAYSDFNVEVINLRSKVDKADTVKSETNKAAGKTKSISSDNIKDIFAKIAAENLKKLKSDSFIIYDKENKITRPVEYGDMAILLSKNSDFTIYEKALKSLNINSRRLSKQGLIDTQEIGDMLSLAKILANPFDSISLIAVLRSLVFNFSDIFLYRLQSIYDASNNSQPLNLPDLIKILKILVDSNDLTLADKNKALRFLDVMARLSFLCKHLSLPELMIGIIDITDFDKLLLTQNNGYRKVQNILKLISIARKFNFLTLSEFANQIEKSYNYGDDYSLALTNDVNAVNLLTIHGAKGLEYPCVVLPLINNNLINTSKIIFDEEFGIVFNVNKESSNSKAAKDNNTVCNYFELVKIMRKEKEEAEKKRLFYVAATRARDKLIILNHEDAKTNNLFSSWFSKYLDVLRDSFKNNSNVKFLDMHLNDYEFKDDKSANLHGSEIFDISDASLIQPIKAIDLPLKMPDKYNQKLFLTHESSLDARLLGSYFHKIMENLPFDYGLVKNELLESLALDFSVINSVKYNLMIDTGKALLEKFYKSELYNLLKVSSIVFHEIPILEFNNNQKIPDLVLKDDNNAWHVVDYKTDKITSDQILAHINDYRKQVGHYEEILTKIFKASFQKHIYFAHLGDLVAFS